MKGLQLGRCVWGRAATARNIFVPSKQTLMQHQSSAKQPSRKLEWTPHSISTPAGLGNDLLSQTPMAETRVHTAYIALGSNLGDRIDWIEKACNEMSARGIKIRRTSCLWETQPMYMVDQDSFINGACEVETTLEPLALLDELQGIENALGREKIIDKGPRNIDLDILLYDHKVIDHERLKVPHPGMFEREFVLRPLAELIPGKTLDPVSPWKVTQDYLNALPLSSSPISTITPLNSIVAPIRALQSNRQTLVMGIMNTTPDSFSDGDSNYPKATAKTSVLDFQYYKGNTQANFGARIIDIGGQSTAPGAPEVSIKEEISRTIPLIRVMKTRPKFPKRVVISIDTYRASVAQAAVEAGADIINDVSAGQMDPEMLTTMARLGKTVCLMHMRGTPGTMNSLTQYPDGLIPTIAKELLARVEAAEAAGIRRWRIILDPGIGFAKNGTQNLEILRRFDELRDWPGLRGLPWLLGSSRKGFVGKITGVTDPAQRVWGTAATVAAAVMGGADIVRVHDVREMVQVVRMSDAIWRV